MSLIQNLYRDYGDFVVDIPNWELADQGVTALMGPSGAGKTSVFRLLIGLEPCPQLSWKFGDQDLAQLSMPKKRLGVVFQHFEIFPHLTSLQNIEFAAQARKISLSEFETMKKELVDVLQLQDCLNTRGLHLSGGEKQRVALARALVGKPRFLFLDEPFSSLDPELRSSARQLVNSAIRSQKVPTLLITHDQQDLDQMADHIVRIKNGRLV